MEKMTDNNNVTGNGPEPRPKLNRLNPIWLVLFALAIAIGNWYFLGFVLGLLVHTFAWLVFAPFIIVQTIWYLFLSLVIYLIARRFFTGYKYVFPIVLAFLIISFNLVGYSMLVINNIQYRFYQAEVKKTLGQHELTGNRQVIMQANADNFSAGKDFFAWTGQDDGFSRRENGSNQSYFVMDFNDKGYDLKKIVTGTIPKPIRDGNSIYWVDKDLYIFDLISNEKKILLTDVHQLHSVYKNKLVISRLSNTGQRKKEYFVFDTNTGLLDQIKYNIKEPENLNDPYFQGRYIYLVNSDVNIPNKLTLSRIDITNQSQTTIEDVEGYYITCLAASDEYFVYTVTPRDNYQFDPSSPRIPNTIKVVSNISKKVVYTETTSNNLDYRHSVIFGDYAYYLVLDPNDSNRFQIARADLLNQTKSIIYNLSENGGSIYNWTINDKHLIHTTGFFADIVLIPLK